MQSDWKEIYKLTAERTNESEQLYKDIGNHVFHALYKTLRRPPCLIVKLKGVGTWYLRRMRMKATLDLFPIDYNKEMPTDVEENIASKLQVLKHENKKEIYEIFKARLAEYEEYIKLRDEIRAIRRKTSYLIQAKDEAPTKTLLDIIYGTSGREAPSKDDPK